MQEPGATPQVRHIFDPVALKARNNRGPSALSRTGVELSWGVAPGFFITRRWRFYGLHPFSQIRWQRRGIGSASSSLRHFRCEVFPGINELISLEVILLVVKLLVASPCC